MLKTAIVSSMVLACALSNQILELDDNFIEIEDFQPIQSISLPYPYQGTQNNHVVMKPVAPAFSGEIIVPTKTEIVEVAPVGFFSTAISCALEAAAAVISFLLTNGPALIVGTVFTLGVCKLTSLCDSQVTIYEAQTELRSLATPERLARAAEFVKEAVKKYSAMQKK